MNIQVVGAGSVGLLLTSFLTELGHQVSLICRNDEQRRRLIENGLIRINLDNSEYRCNVSVAKELICEVDATIITTKSYHLESLYEQLCKLPPNSSLLFMQNGLEHYEKALQLPQQQIAFASVQFGALKEQATVVRHTGVGIFKIAVAKGDVSNLSLASELQHFPIQYVQDAYYMLFEKALLNSFINPLTAILQVKNGVLVKNDYAFTLLQSLYEELLSAFPQEMHQFSFEMVVSLCEKTAQNNSSMYMDRIHHRLSEIDSIVLPIIERGKALGKRLPILFTLYNIVKAMEMEREQSL